MQLLSVTETHQTSPFDAWIVRLPSYSMVDQMGDHSAALVAVPEQDFPVTSLVPGDVGFPQIGEDFVLQVQTAEERAAWIEQLKRRYRRYNYATMAQITQWLDES